jgi:hypothetical protein
MLAHADPTVGRNDPGTALTSTATGCSSASQAYASGANQIDAIDAENQNYVVQAQRVWATATTQASQQLQPALQTWQILLPAVSQWAASLHVVTESELSTVVGTLTGTLASFQATLSAPLSPPRSPGGHLADQGWLDQIAAQLNTLGQTAAAAAALATTTGPALTAATQNEQAALTQLASDTGLVQSAVTAGPLPSDPATLARYLDVVNRLGAGPGSPDPDIVTARQQLLNTTAGPAGVSPAALFPVRLETRIVPGPATAGADLKIRLFVDDIAIDSHDPTLTTDENTWAADLQQAVAAGGAAAAAKWAQTAAVFGPERTAYLNAVDLTDTTLLPPAGTAGRSAWERPVTAALLPDRWLAVALDDNRQPIAAALSGPVTAPLQVSPNPLALPGAVSQPGPPVDAGLAWLVDFDEATQAGMAVTLQLPGGPAGASSPAQVPHLLVVGLQTPGAAAPADIITQALTAHRFTDGLEILAPGTATNNTLGGPSGYSTADPGFADSYSREIAIPGSWAPPRSVPPDSDAVRLAQALGISPGTFVAAGDARYDALAAQAMAALTWEGTWGTCLPWLNVTSAAILDAARAWISAWVKPSGPLPTLRIGHQVYGFQPAVALASFTDTSPIAATVAQAVNAALPIWSAAATAVLAGDINALLARSPVSRDIRATALISGAGTWLSGGIGVMGTPYERLSPLFGTVPEQVATWARSLGFPSPSLQLPPDLLYYPSPPSAPSPWAVTLGNGLPLTSPADGTSVTGFLSSLLTNGPVSGPGPNPDTLLNELANHAWAHTAGVTTSAMGDLVPRGGLGGAPDPGIPAEGDELRGATAWLAARPGACSDIPLAGTLDTVSHRIDAWATALATYRLGQLRQNPPSGSPGILIGGFGWIENLIQRPQLTSAGLADAPAVLTDTANLGFLHAPSLAQATTAAVLRSGHLTNSTAPGTSPPQPPSGGQDSFGRFAVDLSSQRARTAVWLLDGVRRGQPIAALLGYLFERALVETGRGNLVAYFRQIAPADPAANQNVNTPNPAPQETVRATDVVDGITLYQLWQQRQPVTSPHKPGGGGDPWSQAADVLADLASAVDAVADAVTATALHETLAGNHSAAAATFEAVANGSVTADPASFLRTPRTGTTVIHRVLLAIPPAPASPPAGWPALTPRTQAEPGLSQWIASHLPPPAQIQTSVSLTDASGIPIPTGNPATVSVADLGLGPLDLIDLARRPAELTQLIVHRALTAAVSSGQPATGGTRADPAPADGVTPLDYALDIASKIGSSLAASRPADVRDLSVPGTDPGPGVNWADLGQRVDAASSQLTAAIQAAAAALPGVTPPGPGSQPGELPISGGLANLTLALLAAVNMGVAGAAPAAAGGDDASLATLAAQTYAAWAELVRRQAAAAAALAALPANPADTDQLNANLAQLTAIFGPAFTPVPQLQSAAGPLNTSRLTVTAAPPGQEPMAWLVKAAHVWPAVSDLYDAVTAAEIAGSGPPLSVDIAQLSAASPGGAPARAPLPWIGLPFTSGPPPNGTLSLAFVAGPPPSAGDVGAMVLADWPETIPSTAETTAVAFHYDAPRTQPPQTVLIAVPATLTQPAWTYNELLTTVADTLGLARARTADRTDLPAGSRWAQPALYLADTTYNVPAIPVHTGSQYTFLAPTPPAVVTSVAGGAQLVQGTQATLHITGSNLADPTLQFQFQPAGITQAHNGYAPAGPAGGTLVVNVDPNGAVGAYSIQAGAGPELGPAVSNINVLWRPQVNPTPSPTILAQRLRTGTPNTQTVTISGHRLTRASVTPSGSAAALVKINSVTNSDDDHISVSLTIADSAGPIVVGGSGPGGFTKPVVIPLRHVPVPLTLLVTPIGVQQPTQVSLTIDCLVSGDPPV